MRVSKIRVTEKSICVPVYVFRSGKHGLTISCADSKHAFKFGTTEVSLRKFRAKLEELFVELIERKSS